MQDNEHFPATETHEENTQTNNDAEQVNHQSQQQAPTEESSSARNFRQLREKAERAERERDEAMQYIRTMQAQQQKPKDEDDDLADDDLVERKHVDRIVDKKIRKYEEQLQQYQQEQQAQQILNQYKDYHAVVSEDNVNTLINEYPEIADSLKANQDMKSKAIATYNIIKKLGLNNAAAAAQPYSQDIERIQKNAAKPKPLASVNPQQGDSPLSRANAFANGLTEELKDQLRKEMSESRRGY